MISGCCLRFVYAVEVYAAIVPGDRERFLCGSPTFAVAMPFCAGETAEFASRSGENPCNLSGVARGLLQGGPLQLPMGPGDGEELTKSSLTYDQLRVQNLALPILCCFSPTNRQEASIM